MPIEDESAPSDGTPSRMHLRATPKLRRRLSLFANAAASIQDDVEHPNKKKRKPRRGRRHPSRSVKAS